MKIWKKCVLFYIGGTVYMLVEFGFRGWSHGSMFLAGGTCFLLLGKLMRLQPRLSPVPRVLLGATVITAVELAAGLLVNRDYRVWDYRNTPFNFHGQICLPFSLLWIPVAFGAMELYDVTENLIKT